MYLFWSAVCLTVRGLPWMRQDTAHVCPYSCSSLQLLVVVVVIKMDLY